MATANQLLSLKEEATCSICLEYFTNPVSVDCGHIFCLFCISQYWKDLQTDFPCPECRDTCQRRRLRPNNRLANMVDTLKHLDVPSATPQDPNLCRKHEERLKLFCEDDQETICMVCSVSRDHKEHMVVPIREAAQEHKAKCLSYIDSLMKRREELRTVQRKEETNLRQLKDQFKSQEERITNEFEKLQQFLEEEKSCHLHNLKEKEKKSLQSIEQKVTRLEEKQIALRSLTTEISLKCHQQDVELLKNTKSTLSRCENANVQHTDYDIFMEKEEKTDVEDGADLQIKIIKSLEWRWARSFAAGGTLDADTAYQELILSEDGRSVRLRDETPELPDTPQKPSPVIFLMGRGRLSSGRHYWELEVGDKPCWTLGVCTASVSRNGKIKLLPENGFWTVWLRNGKYKALTSPSTLLTPRVPPRAVGLFLDYEAGRLSVYNVDDRSLLFTFMGASFPPTLRRVFSQSVIDGRRNSGAVRILLVTGWD